MSFPAITAVFNLAFLRNTFLSCIFLFFIIVDLYILILAVTAQIFNPTAELAIPTGTPTNEVNAKIEAQTLTVETKKK